MSTITRFGSRALQLSQTLSRAFCTAGGARVDITPRCVERIKELQRIRSTNIVLRVTVDGGGCSGFQYGFELENWDKEPAKNQLQNDGDNLFERDGAFVIIDDLSLAYIAGSKVDYLEEMISSSFRIMDNPNSEASCGCGVSFSPKV